MTAFECVKKGFSVAKRSSELLLILFIAAFVEGVANLPFQAAATPETPQFTGPQILMGIFFRLLGVFLFAGALVYISEVVKQGKSSFDTFKSGGKRCYLRMLIVTIAFAVVLTLIRLVIQTVVNIMGGIANPVAVVISLIVAAVLFVGFSFLMLAPYAVTVKDVSVKEAFPISIQFVKSNLQKVLTVAIIIFTIAIILGFLVGAFLGLLSNLLDGFAVSIANIFVLSLFTTYVQVVAFGSLMALFETGSGSSPAVAAE